MSLQGQSSGLDRFIEMISEIVSDIVDPVPLMRQRPCLPALTRFGIFRV
jgi:hypothetical protein